MTLQVCRRMLRMMTVWYGSEDKAQGQGRRGVLVQEAAKSPHRGAGSCYQAGVSVSTAHLASISRCDGLQQVLDHVAVAS